MLTGIGIAVATAILFDMLMLSGGIVLSFRRELEALGFELRVSPKGTLPFSTTATFPDAEALAARLLEDPSVERVGVLLGATVYAEPAGRPQGGRRTGEEAVFAVGVDPVAQAVFRSSSGSALPESGAVAIANQAALDAWGIETGGTILCGADRDAATGALQRARAIRIIGTARFSFDARGQRTLALPLGTLQGIEGKRERQEASLFLVDLRDGDPAAATVRRLRSALPSVDVYSLEDLMRSVRARLSYFQQFARILSMISLIVNFLLVATIATISVHERTGEIAMLRAMGFTRGRVATLVLLEGGLLAVASGAAGLGLGTILGRVLDGILRASPGLPEEVAFFVVTPASVFGTVGFVLLVGTFGGAVGAYFAVRRPIAATLRAEAA
jgi:putative ABC transport system permease protein